MLFDVYDCDLEEEMCVQQMQESSLGAQAWKQIPQLLEKKEILFLCVGFFSFVSHLFYFYRKYRWTVISIRVTLLEREDLVH